MNDDWQDIVKQMPLAFCLNEAVRDKNKQITDYRLIESNLAFKTVFQPDGQVKNGLMSSWLGAGRKDYQKWLAVFRQQTASTTPLGIAGILEHKGHWFSVSAWLMTPDRLVLFFHETARFKAAQLELTAQAAKHRRSLADSQALAQLIIQHSPFAFITYKVVGDGSSSSDYIVSSANPACLKIENWQDKKITGQPLSSLRPGADRFGIIPVLQRVWLTGQPAFYPATVYNEAGLGVRWFENNIFRLPSGEVVAVYRDVTDQQVAQQALAAEREKLKGTLLSIGDGVITTNNRGQVEMINQAAEKLTGWNQAKAAGQPLDQVLLFAGPGTNGFSSSAGALQQADRQVRLRSKSGREYPVLISSSPIRSENGKIIGSVLVLKDISEELRTRARLDFLSDKDPLTGLYNRSYIEKILPELGRKQHLPLAVLMGDLDGLKLINDAFGHRTGDEVLLKIADIIRNSIGKDDLAARWGNDEFLLLLPRTSEEAARTISARIKQEAGAARIAGIALSISLGQAKKTRPRDRWRAVLKEAEDNMNKTKLLGVKSYRNTVLQSIRTTLYARSLETEEHGVRIGWFCRQIGLELGLNPGLLDELEVFAMLHDVGKIGIDDRILQKPDDLSEEEMAQMRQHPQIGSRIVSTVPELQSIAAYILAHHERWDGKGYPRGLSGTNIPLPARILAVADAYDAMTQDRPYRQALPDSRARQELIKNAARQFDPQIVNIFLAWLDQEEAAAQNK